MKQYSLVTIECNHLQSYVQDQQPSSFFLIIFLKVFFVFISLLAIFSFVTEVFLLGELLALRRIVECMSNTLWVCLEPP